ncbi:MAG: preprotein translocase subunit SecG [SAR116 cluster bacterium]|nr:preprotein translocase subunit SecG [Paracoccaceae bacterium]RCL81240.1 MAG: preprotein translocase subunit SecG [SAR116 cluster bacterium]RPH14357.1 MAG: preprotein translocase subunit SecG [Alphaproteobacteria bacterium TMED150]HBQ22653.1 preprotein translocase subunit SecG [Alphaproteobacteria bacterium]|tara:strand:+ start:329 stop:658 length:330 start_codon:yes stop_codon:yes gene_type:complete
MQEILTIVHIIIVVLLIGVVLLQRSEGGVLGIGGGQNAFMSGRSAANAMTRTTSILAVLFVCSSLGLALIAGTFKDGTIVDEIEKLEESSQPVDQKDITPGAPAIPLND